MTDEENNAIRLCMAEELDRHKESLNAPFLCVCGRQYEIEDFPDHLVASMHKAITRAFGEVHRPEFSDPSDDNDPYCAGCGNEWPIVRLKPAPTDAELAAERDAKHQALLATYPDDWPTGEVTG